MGETVLRSRVTRWVFGGLAWAFWGAGLTDSVKAVTIDTLIVGNPGNVGEESGGLLSEAAIVGGVGYSYEIGKYEVTNSQYVEFLNAKATTDPQGLYNTMMSSSLRGGIDRTGSAGSYRYQVKSNMGDKPVIYVSYFDAMRFANWLHNGQGSSDTEVGAYTISQGIGVTRNPRATWFVPSEDEWYKAAYYDPTLNGGAGGYYDYATRSNVAPQPALANSLGVISNPGPNVANYRRSATWNSITGNLTSVGSAGPASASFYGTYDQNGNVWEWNEEKFGSSGRGVRGGSWDEFASGLRASERLSASGGSGDDLPFMGFRLARLPKLLTDLDRDSDVDSGDLLSFLENWTGSEYKGPPKNWDYGDTDFDGDVDSNDLLYFVEHWTGSSAAERGSLAVVPEPHLGLAGIWLGILAAQGLRRRRLN